MRLIDSIATLFINTFGITVPSERARHRASWFIFAMLLGCLALVAFLAFLLFGQLHR